MSEAGPARRGQVKDRIGRTADEEGASRMSQQKKPKSRPGICIPWEEKLKELPELTGDKELFRRVWEDNEALAYTYIWHCLLSF